MGGNHSSTKLLFERAVSAINSNFGLVSRVGSIYRSNSWGYESEFYFLNQLVELSTHLDANVLLTKLKELEIELGREPLRDIEYTDRKIDLDILYFGQQVINQSSIQIPHPRLQQRKFALEPLVEMIPNFIHPVFQKENSALLEECTDQGIVVRL
jgi:2-amino-4-hydroxy-6-hydroxymethyldihydropteridine diphosphokinase